jgi:hypothetical protein
MASASNPPLSVDAASRKPRWRRAQTRWLLHAMDDAGQRIAAAVRPPADLVALDPSGELWIIEIKSSNGDFRADQKWQDYRAHCDRLFRNDGQRAL